MPRKRVSIEMGLLGAEFALMPVMSTTTKKNHAGMPEEPSEEFDIDSVFPLLRQSVFDFPKAAMFDLRDRGFSSPSSNLSAA